MAILGKQETTAANTEVVIYTVPAGKTAVIGVNVCNRNGASSKVRLGLRSASGEASTANKSYLEYDTALPANGVLERTGFLLAAGEAVVGQADATGVNFIVLGLEE